MINNTLRLFMRYCWGIGGFLTFSFFTHAWGFCPDVPGIVIWIMMLYCIIKGCVKGNVNFIALLFLCMLPWGIVYFNPDLCFKSWLRYANFVLLFISIGPIFNNSRMIKFRLQAINMMLVLSIFTGVVSFFCFFLGINFMNLAEAQDLYRAQGGYFGGLCVHSMTLGPIAAIGVVGSFYLYMKHKKKIVLGMFVCCLGAVLFAASRSALLASVAGIIAVTWCYSIHRTIMVKRILLLAILALISFPIWKGSTNLIASKQLANEAMGSATSSRDAKYDYRIEEFKESPLFGVGFCAIDPKTGDEYHANTGTIEPGTAWMQVPSMTGLAGTIPFVFLLLGIWKKTYRQIFYTQRGLFLGLLVAFFFHFFAEGYLFSAGNELCFMSWLVIAVCGMPWYKNLKVDDKLTILD